MLRVLCLVILVACGSGAATSAPPQQPAEAPEEGRITTDDGVELYYRKVGRGPVVAIVPGALFYGREVQDAIGARGAAVFYDMRNRGKSSSVADASKISLEHDLRDLERVRAHVKAEKFAPIGWSYLGKMVALYTAAHPDRVTRVVMFGPLARDRSVEVPREYTAAGAGAPEVPDAAGQAELKRLRASELPATDPAEHCAREWAIFGPSLVADAARVAALPTPCTMQNEWPVHLGKHFQTLFPTIMALSPPWEHFAAVRVPVLVIHGRWDRQSPYGAGRDWAQHLPDARLVTVEKAAHAGWVDDRDLLGTIGEFLGGRWPANAAVVKP